MQVHRIKVNGWEGWKGVGNMLGSIGMIVAVFIRAAERGFNLCLTDWTDDAVLIHSSPSAHPPAPLTPGDSGAAGWWGGEHPDRHQPQDPEQDERDG